MATSIQLRRTNRNEVYRAILREKETTKQLLANQLRLSFPTVSQILSELEEEGLIASTGESRRTGGRKAQIIASRPDVHVALGLDITPNHINLVMVDLGRNILKSVREHIRYEASDDYYRHLQEVIDTVSEDYRDRVLGMVISIPAIVREDGQTVTYAPLLKDSLGLYHLLEPYIRYPYYLINDASAAAYSEITEGCARSDFVYLMLSNTVGGAIISEGQIRQGLGIRAGEFGHVTLVPGGRRCYCGQLGCVDAYCSALQLSDQLEPYFAKLAAGDTGAKEKWEEYLEYLAVVINNLQVSMNQEIVIGGYVGWFIKPYLPGLQQRVSDLCCFKDETIRISAGQYAAEAAAVGAALQIIDEFIRNV